MNSFKSQSNHSETNQNCVSNEPFGKKSLAGSPDLTQCSVCVSGLVEAPDRMQILEWLAVFTCKSHIPTYIACRAARLQATYHTASRQLLVFHAD